LSEFAFQLLDSGIQKLILSWKKQWRQITIFKFPLSLDRHLRFYPMNRL